MCKSLQRLSRYWMSRYVLSCLFEYSNPLFIRIHIYSLYSMLTVSLMCMVHHAGCYCCWLSPGQQFSCVTFNSFGMPNLQLLKKLQPLPKACLSSSHWLLQMHALCPIINVYVCDATIACKTCLGRSAKMPSHVRRSCPLTPAAESD
jgi:hypothetical protein